MHLIKAKNILLFIFCFFMLCNVNKLSAEKIEQAAIYCQVHSETGNLQKDCIKQVAFEQDAHYYNPWSSKKFAGNYHPKFRHVRNNVQPAKPTNGWQYEIFTYALHHDFNNSIDALSPPYYYAFLFRLTPF
jgi:hypothetical protein